MAAIRAIVNGLDERREVVSVSELMARIDVNLK
jgi:hypothetical protein